MMIRPFAMLLVATPSAASLQAGQGDQGLGQTIREAVDQATREAVQEAQRARQEAQRARQEVLRETQQEVRDAQQGVRDA